MELNEDMLIACMDLVGRSGASDFDLGWTCPHVPDEPEGHSCPDVTWHAEVRYRGTRITTDEHKTPTTAALALAERLLRGAMCRCRELVALADGQPGCRWRLSGRRWEPGCDVPSVRVHGERGDYAAMQRAMGEPLNRKQRRAAKRGKGGITRG